MTRICTATRREFGNVMPDRVAVLRQSERVSESQGCNSSPPASRGRPVHVSIKTPPLRPLLCILPAKNGLDTMEHFRLISSRELHNGQKRTYPHQVRAATSNTGGGSALPQVWVRVGRDGSTRGGGSGARRDSSNGVPLEFTSSSRRT